MSGHTPWIRCPHGTAFDGSSCQISDGTGWFMEMSIGYPVKELDYPGEDIKQFDEQVTLLLACRNACMTVNPSNPVAAAEAYQDVFAALEMLHRLAGVQELYKNQLSAAKDIVEAALSRARPEPAAAIERTPEDMQS